MPDLDGELRLDMFRKGVCKGGTHPRCMVMLYKDLVGPVLKYGSVCYSGMTRTLLFRLERDQYRGIRIALGITCSTPNN
jgi:hypothetical protein